MVSVNHHRRGLILFIVALHYAPCILAKRGGQHMNPADAEPAEERLFHTDVPAGEWAGITAQGFAEPVTGVVCQEKRS